MRNIHRRLRVLEQLPQFQPPLSLLEQIQSLALQSVSDEDLDLLGSAARKQAGQSRPIELLEAEEAACDVLRAAVETAARRMGFKSFADAARPAR
jgi:hypothetical protein